MKMKHAFAAGLAALTMASVGVAQAAPIFTENFEGTLGQWAPNISGNIVADPLNGSNKVLAFGAGGSGGDIFTAAPYMAGGTYHLVFDLLGTCQGMGGNCGAFIGIDQFPGGEIWIAGDNTYNPKSYLMQNNGTWQHFDFLFTANAAGTFRLKIEDFVLSPPAGDVFFDNVCIGASSSDCSASVPEPVTLGLLGLGMAGLGFARRRKQQTA